MQLLRKPARKKYLKLSAKINFHRGEKYSFFRLRTLQQIEWHLICQNQSSQLASTADRNGHTLPKT